MPQLFPAWTAIIGFIFGAFIGSFLNMAIYRLPRGKSFVNPSRSFCPKCEHSLGSADLMPILSWIFAGGKCRYCKGPISSRYLWVELLTASLFAGIWWRFLTDSYEPIRMVAYLLAAACLVAIIFIDAELFIIPDEINAMILLIGIVYRWADHTLMTGLYGALLGWGLLFGVQLLGRLAFQKDAMGDGDVKMMRGIGMLLGPMLLVGNFGMAVVLGLVGGLVGIAITKANERKASSQTANAAASGTASELTDEEMAAHAAQSEPVEEEEYMPTPVPLLLLSGAWYLFCLDVIGLVVPPIRMWVESKFPSETVEEEDDWKPTATTIPFGPYLAAGALVCMLFAAPIANGLRSYFRLQPPETGPALVIPSLFRESTTRLN